MARFAIKSTFKSRGELLAHWLDDRRGHLGLAIHRCDTCLTQAPGYSSGSPRGLTVLPRARRSRCLTARGSGTCTPGPPIGLSNYWRWQRPTLNAANGFARR